MDRIFKQIIDSNRAVIIFLILVGMIAYASMAFAPFKTHDDQFSIVANTQIKSFKNIGTIFTGSFFNKKVYYRPLVSLTYMMEYQAFGLKAGFYYLDNILLHILSSIAVFFLITRLVNDRTVGFCVALLFVLHPLHWEAVANIPGRAVLLAGFFVLAAFLCYLKAHREGDLFYFGVSLFSFVLALLSKESAAMFPVVLGAYVFFLERRTNQKQGLYTRVLPYLGILIFYLAWRRFLGITTLYTWRTPQEYVLGVLSFLRGILTYLRLFFVPVDLHFDRSRAVWMSFNNIELWLTVLVYAAAIYLLFGTYRKISRKVLFFTVWFFMELVPVSQIVIALGVQPGHIFIAEHFVYVASVAFFAFCVLRVKKLSKSKWFTRFIPWRTLRPLIIVFYAFLLIVTTQQGIFAMNEAAMYRRTLQFAPHNTRIRNAYALWLASEGRFPEAEKQFRVVLEVAPRDVRARIGLGKSLCDQDKLVEGLREYEKIPDAGTDAELLAENKRLTYGLLIERYLEKKRKDPRNAQLEYSLGVAYTQTGDIDKGIDHFFSAVRYDSKNKNALFNLASLLYAKGNKREANIYLKRMVGLDGEKDWMDLDAYTKLGAIYREWGKDRKAEEYLKKAQELRESVDR